MIRLAIRDTCLDFFGSGNVTFTESPKCLIFQNNQSLEVMQKCVHQVTFPVPDSFGFQVERIEITELREKTFFADIYFRGSTGVEVVSARPSDALAIAVRTGAAIYADEEVLNQASYLADEDDELSEDQVEEFREFLDSVNPDDFAE